MRLRTVASFAIVTLTTAACGSGAGLLEAARSSSADLARGMSATITWNSIEGGFWEIRGADGVLYDPHPTIAPEFQFEGLEVRFAARLRPDLACFHQVGPIVSVTEIRRR